MNNTHFDDLTGRTFGRWKVARLDRKDKYRVLYWRCVCECGKERVVKAQSLRSGDSKSCGCWKSERITKLSTAHGAAKTGAVTPEYWAWSDARKRCLNPNHKWFASYGARGIVICERWEKFETFLADMGLRPSPDHSLDRINNDGPYSPENCRWATRSEQQRNKKRGRKDAS